MFVVSLDVVVIVVVIGVIVVVVFGGRIDDVSGTLAKATAVGLRRRLHVVV